MSFSIALQLYTLRDIAQSDLSGALDQAAGMGYKGIELAGLYGKTAAEMRGALAAAGLEALSAHVPYVELIKDTARTLDTYAEIGCRYIAIPFLNPEHRPGTPGYAQVLENIWRIGEASKALGIPLLYHNHDFEFMRLPDGRAALDALYQDIPADILGTQIDTCWVKVAGRDPAEYVRSHKGRAPLVHLKDFWLEGELIGAAYELLGEGKRPDTFASAFSFRALGQGMQDVPSIVDAAEYAGAGWLIIEQDGPAPGSTPLADAKSGIDYLKTVLKGRGNS